MDTRKLGKPTDQKLALVSNLATDLLWYGHIETTFDRARAAAAYAEKVINYGIFEAVQLPLNMMDVKNTLGNDIKNLAKNYFHKKSNNSSHKLSFQY